VRRPMILGYEYKDEGDSGVRLEASNEVLGSEIIVRKLKELVEVDKLVF
jgi:hypothetical protein